VYEGGFLKWGLPKSPWLSTLSLSLSLRAIAEGRDCHFSRDAHQQRGLNDLDICRWKVGKNDEQRSYHAMLENGLKMVEPALKMDGNWMVK